MTGAAQLAANWTGPGLRTSHQLGSHIDKSRRKIILPTALFLISWRSEGTKSDKTRAGQSCAPEVELDPGQTEKPIWRCALVDILAILRAAMRRVVNATRLWSVSATRRMKHLPNRKGYRHIYTASARLFLTQTLLQPLSSQWTIDGSARCSLSDECTRTAASIRGNRCGRRSSASTP